MYVQDSISPAGSPVTKRTLVWLGQPVAVHPLSPDDVPHTKPANSVEEYSHTGAATQADIAQHVTSEETVSEDGTGANLAM